MSQEECFGEDVLEIYHLPYDSKYPVICMDEQPIQLVKETRVPLAAKPGQPYWWNNFEFSTQEF